MRALVFPYMVLADMSVHLRVGGSNHTLGHEIRVAIRFNFNVFYAGEEP
jgi:hypothetical protein